MSSCWMTRRPGIERDTTHHDSRRFQFVAVDHIGSTSRIAIGGHMN